MCSYKYACVRADSVVGQTFIEVGEWRMEDRGDVTTCLSPSGYNQIVEGVHRYCFRFQIQLPPSLHLNCSYKVIL